jgi:dCMP deaminase
MRPNRDRWAMRLAEVTAERATCLRRHVGCVLVNRQGHILSTGYNGVARGQLHCNRQVSVGTDYTIADFSGVSVPQKMITITPNACAGATAESGTKLDSCQAVHAEQNALLQCADVDEICRAYVTTSPCLTCVKLLMNTNCQHILFRDEYPHKEARELWTSNADRTWTQMSPDLRVFT